MVNLEHLLEKAKDHLKGSGDNKVWCETEELIALLKAGAQPITLNQEQIGQSYLHRVSYQGIKFTNATAKHVQKLDRYLN